MQDANLCGGMRGVNFGEGQARFEFEQERIRGAYGLGQFDKEEWKMRIEGRGCFEVRAYWLKKAHRASFGGSYVNLTELAIERS